MFVEKKFLQWEHYYKNLLVKMNNKNKLWNAMGSTTLFVFDVMQRNFHDKNIIWSGKADGGWSQVHPYS